VAVGPAPIVGLDVGTSAVRAAQISTGRGGLSLAAFGQFPLPPEAIVDGEIRDSGAVAEAISRLWKRSKIHSKKVVIGLANQRVVVRQVDLPYLEEKELRSSLRFQAADHIPMPVEEAELDFQILYDYTTDEGEHLMRVLLVAAATEMVERFVDTVQTAGLEVVGVDLTPFAVARAVSPSARGEVGVAGAQAIVDVGAGVTNIIVHVGGEPRFVRILLVGGEDITTALARDLQMGHDQAEALKFDLTTGSGNPEALRLLSREVDSLVEEIRGSIDYYNSREDTDHVSSVILTGGGSMVLGLVDKLEAGLRTSIELAAPLGEVKTKLKDTQIVAIQPVVAAAIGLAMGVGAR
jgi:type IV pilus assembly protein PilM